MFELIPKHERRAENTTRGGVLLWGVWKSHPEISMANTVFTVFYVSFQSKLRLVGRPKRKRRSQIVKIYANFKTSLSKHRHGHSFVYTTWWTLLINVFEKGYFSLCILNHEMQFASSKEGFFCSISIVSSVTLSTHLYFALSTSRSQAKLFTALGDSKKPERFDRGDVAPVRNGTVSPRRRLTVLTSYNTNVFPLLNRYYFSARKQNKTGLETNYSTYQLEACHNL